MQMREERPGPWPLSIVRLAVTLCVFAVAPAPGARADADGGHAAAGNGPVLSQVRAHYLVGCGGCHGITGVSASDVVPDLKEQAGYFLCSPKGREYMIHLPNVAFSPLSSADLADLMNYVAFGLGGKSVPAGARPYTAAEVAGLRQAPFRNYSLQSYRLDVVRDVIHACPQAATVIHAYDLALDKREIDNK
ncbi:hypothetical protein [Komagataeibacter swingsii]|uniref:Cytochrome C n=1 Tax=Komagataeibacter swingsii TaxID=215220 RepID=A0A2V4RPE8_9PROT|nr:hypothetical protein [Komagataeibacter swingsii]PYD70889.1 hypothetical protein CFR76_02900 [Komagataeibacter swingsii]GBQ60709.1 hypothetical protein AA16373_1965 [Komagataeibacter swingsii DSM 16373]